MLFGSQLGNKKVAQTATTQLTPRNIDSFGNPIDITRPKLLNKDGSFSTELTITVFGSELGFTGPKAKMGYNIPTIFNGKRHNQEQAIEGFKKGINPSVGVFKNIDIADKAAVQRSKDIGKLRGKQ